VCLRSTIGCRLHLHAPAPLLAPQDDGLLPLPSQGAPGPAPPPGIALLAETLLHIVGHCAGGPELLLDAVELTINAARAWHVSGGCSSGSGSSTGRSLGVDATAAAEADDMRTATTAARAWALALQWILYVAPRPAMRGALTRLSALAVTLVCWPATGSADAPIPSAPSDAWLQPSSSVAWDSDVAAAADMPAPQRVVSPAITPDSCSGSGHESGSSGADDCEARGPGPSPQGACTPQAFLAGLQAVSQVCARIPVVHL
jgi:hypothetical protein